MRERHFHDPGDDGLAVDHLLQERDVAGLHDVGVDEEDHLFLVDRVVGTDGAAVTRVEGVALREVELHVDAQVGLDRLGGHEGPHAVGAADVPEVAAQAAAEKTARGIVGPHDELRHVPFAQEEMEQGPAVQAHERVVVRLEAGHLDGQRADARAPGVHARADRRRRIGQRPPDGRDRLVAAADREREMAGFPSARRNVGQDDGTGPERRGRVGDLGRTCAAFVRLHAFLPLRQSGLRAGELPQVEIVRMSVQGMFNLERRGNRAEVLGGDLEDEGARPRNRVEAARESPARQAAFAQQHLGTPDMVRRGNAFAVEAEGERQIVAEIGRRMHPAHLGHVLNPAVDREVPVHESAVLRLENRPAAVEREGAVQLVGKRVPLDAPAFHTHVRRQRVECQAANECGNQGVLHGEPFPLLAVGRIHFLYTRRRSVLAGMAVSADTLPLSGSSA